MNEQDILNSATQAAEWLFDRRERLEKHEHDLLTLLWLSISEIDAIIDSFDALEAAHGLTLDEQVYETISSTGSEEVLSRKARDAGLAVRPAADAGALLPPEPGRAEAAPRTPRTRTSAKRATTMRTELNAGWPE